MIMVFFPKFDLQRIYGLSKLGPAEFQVTWTQEKLKKQPIRWSKVVFRNKYINKSLSFCRFLVIHGKLFIVKRIQTKTQFQLVFKMYLYQIDFLNLAVIMQ